MSVARVVEIQELMPKDGAATYNVWPIGDTHLGAPDTCEDTLKKHLKAIERDPMARIIFMGDVGDLIDYRDQKRWHPHKLPDRYIDAMLDGTNGGVPAETVAHACELFEPVKGKIWGWLSGNHERSIAKYHSLDVGTAICQELGIQTRYLSYGGYVIVRFRDRTNADGTRARIVFDLHHGWQGGRRAGAKVNDLELVLGHSDADIVLRGHSHDRLAHVFPSVKIGGKHAREWPRAVAHTGTYKMGWLEDTDTWEETRGFRRKNRTRLGPPVIHITIPGMGGRQRGRGDAHVELSVTQ